MPYEGEYAGYRSLRRIAETARVQQLLRRSRVLPAESLGTPAAPVSAPVAPESLPEFTVAVDGSYAEVDVRNGYPGAKVGYCSVASVLVNLRAVDRLDESRPADPVEFRRTEEAAAVDAALPGSNVITRDHSSARDSFREAVFDVLHDAIVDEEDRTPLLDTYEALLAFKPGQRPQVCPYDYDGCDEHLTVARGLSTCACPRRRPIYSTDALRVHERFNDVGTNGEVFGVVMQIWERVLLVHLLRCFERRGWLDRASRLAFFLDGPLAVFGPPAWLSAAIQTELQRLNTKVRAQTGTDLVILGVEKSGGFVTHFDEIDQMEDNSPRFPPRSYFMLTDHYIKERVIFSDSPKRYGADTYFGRKFFYKTASGARIVASIPFLTPEQDTLDIDDVALYPQFSTACALLDKLVTSRYPNALSPLVSAHAQAAIPLHLGAKVLQQLARALMRP
ncbi:MAG: DNA double-strand break repair nuclease NurA [Terrimicrobiaceae bacterium]|nr:DNA double-strand break repair nuclease NurA [Terrimicrobiaceae bacterium]